MARALVPLCVSYARTTLVYSGALCVSPCAVGSKDAPLGPLQLSGSSHRSKWALLTFGLTPS